MSEVGPISKFELKGAVRVKLVDGSELKPGILSDACMRQ